MNPAGTPEIKPFPKHDGPLVATHLVIVCHCSDDKLRTIQFEGKQAKKIYGYLEHIQGGRVKMKREPVLLVDDSPLVRQAIEQAVNPPPKLTWWETLIEACRRPYPPLPGFLASRLNP